MKIIECEFCGGSWVDIIPLKSCPFCTDESSDTYHSDAVKTKAEALKKMVAEGAEDLSQKDWELIAI